MPQHARHLRAESWLKLSLPMKFDLLSCWPFASSRYHFVNSLRKQARAGNRKSERNCFVAYQSLILKLKSMAACNWMPLLTRVFLSVPPAVLTGRSFFAHAALFSAFRVRPLDAELLKAILKRAKRQTEKFGGLRDVV